jgi:hypothetical protein
VIFFPIPCYLKTVSLSQAILDRIHLKATAVYNQILTNPLYLGGYQDSFDDAELRIFGGHTVVSQIESHKLPAPKLPLTNIPNQDTHMSNIPPQDVDHTLTDSRSTVDGNIFYEANGINKAPPMFGHDPMPSEYIASSYHFSPQNLASVGSENSTYDNDLLNVPWADLIAPVDPNFTTMHTDESKLIDNYWTSLMREAGVLDNFPRL